MSSVTNEITIAQPIEDVFAVLTDVELTGRWFPGDVEEHWTSPPPTGVGSTRHAVVRMFGRRSENDAVATEYDPPHRAAMRGTTPNAPFLVTLEFARVPGGTLVRVTSSIEFPGRGRIAGPLVTFLYGRGMATGLADAKRLMESGVLVPRTTNPQDGTTDP